MKSPKPRMTVCVTPKLSGVGGMVSFQHKLVPGLEKSGVEVNFDLKDMRCQNLLVVGGTRRFGTLRKARSKGIPIFQRLDGINWIHRQRPTGWRHWLRAEYGNWLLSTIRRRFANQIVYQSKFVRKWWRESYGGERVKSRVIYNGVDLNEFSHKGSEHPPEDRYRLLLVEGSLLGGYEFGLTTALQLAETIASQNQRPVELVIAGRVSERQKRIWAKRENVSVQWAGLLPQRELPEIYRSAHLLYSADLNAACPNSVIEALACGLPVLAFDTGALAELVDQKSGQLADYGGDPWKLESPDIPALAKSANVLLENQYLFRAGARARAEEAFSLDQMVLEYMDTFNSQNG